MLLLYDYYTTDNLTLIPPLPTTTTTTTGTAAESLSEQELQELLRKRKTEVATKLVHSHFSPEFVNRLDDVIVFNPLNQAAMLRICDIQLQKVEMLRVASTLMVTFIDDCVVYCVCVCMNIYFICIQTQVT